MGDKGFKKGRAKTGGRQKGIQNRATLEGREFCRSIVDDPVYRDSLKARMISGSVSPGVEGMVWDRAYGKVKEVVEHKGAAITPLQIVLTHDSSASDPERRVS